MSIINILNFIVLSVGIFSILVGIMSFFYLFLKEIHHELKKQEDKKWLMEEN